MSQAQNILAHLEAQGSITAIEALELYGCFRLAARIKDLRDSGHQIETQDVTLGNGKTIAKYTIVKEAQRVFSF
ncbi:helix-turn-helix domain [Caudoviricetes sp.]|nr:helix-turn-helix domain [Caudoviricetes sp.]